MSKSSISTARNIATKNIKTSIVTAKQTFETYANSYLEIIKREFIEKQKGAVKQAERSNVLLQHIKNVNDVLQYIDNEINKANIL